MRPALRKGKIEQVFLIALLVLVVCIYLFPFYIAIINTFKTKLETAQSALSLPSSISLDNYIKAAEKISFAQALKNTMIVTAIGDVLIIVCASLCGYAIARNANKIKFFKVLDRVLLSSIMIPFQVIMVPAYRFYKVLGLTNTLAGVIIALVGLSVAYSSFLYAGFVKSIPYELEEAAHIDGLGPLRTFTAIVLPLLKPITATIATLHAMWLWNDFNTALIILQKDAVRTLTVKQFYFFSQYSADYNMAFAAAVMGMIPVLLLFLFLQKYMISGITSGAVKG